MLADVKTPESQQGGCVCHFDRTPACTILHRDGGDEWMAGFVVDFQRLQRPGQGLALRVEDLTRAGRSVDALDDEGVQAGHDAAAVGFDDGFLAGPVVEERARLLILWQRCDALPFLWVEVTLADAMDGSLGVDGFYIHADLAVARDGQERKVA